MGVVNYLGGGVNLSATEALVDRLGDAVGTYPIMFSITNTLSNCTSSNSDSTIQQGDSYSATITPDEGYTLVGAIVSVLMGETDITSTTYSEGVISIDNVSGDISINIEAVAGL